MADTAYIVTGDPCLRGVPVRPAPDSEPAQVTLTATIRRGEDSDTKEFDVTVLPWTHTEVVAQEITFLTFASIRGNNLDEASVISDLNLRTTGFQGTQITWHSNVSSLVGDGTNETTLGEVTRPMYSVGNQRVTLTATVKSGNAEPRTVSFDLTILKQPATSKELVDEFLSTFNATDFTTGDDRGVDPVNVGIKENLNLPASAPGNAASNITIAWTSKQPDVISTTGAVVRQAVSVIVEMTATVSHGAYTTEKKFNIRVIQLD